MALHRDYAIDLSDIAALRIDCKHCGSALSIALPSRYSDEWLTESPLKCPVCDHQWTGINTTNVNRLSEMIQTLKESLAGSGKLSEHKPAPFSLHFELSHSITDGLDHNNFPENTREKHSEESEPARK